MTKNIIRSIVVDVPLVVAYQIWGNFEGYPEFLEGVEEVRVTGRMMRWKTRRGTETLQWDARVLELTPPRRIAWVTHRDGYPKHVVIALRSQGERNTEVTLGSQYQIIPGEQDQLGSTIDRHLTMFKAYAERGKAKQQDAEEYSAGNWTGPTSTEG